MGGVFSLTGAVLCVLVWFSLTIMGMSGWLTQDLSIKPRDYKETWWYFGLWILTGSGATFCFSLTYYLWR